MRQIQYCVRTSADTHPMRIHPLTYYYQPSDINYQQLGRLLNYRSQWRQGPSENPYSHIRQCRYCPLNLPGS